MIREGGAAGLYWSRASFNRRAASWFRSGGPTGSKSSDASGSEGVTSILGGDLRARYVRPASPRSHGAPENATIVAGPSRRRADGTVEVDAAR